MKEPLAVGTPEIIPVVELISSPGGDLKISNSGKSDWSELEVQNIHQLLWNNYSQAKSLVYFRTWVYPFCRDEKLANSRAIPIYEQDSPAS